MLWSMLLPHLVKSLQKLVKNKKTESKSRVCWYVTRSQIYVDYSDSSHNDVKDGYRYI